MKARSLTQIADWIGADLSRAKGSLPVTGASIDSRSTRLGDLFFALPGARVHGVAFAADARRHGAVAVVTTPEFASRVEGPVLSVANPRLALGQLAARVREHESDKLAAVAITGSVGKTTTCRYLAGLLAGQVVVQHPPASFNNDLGVPLTILNADPACEVLLCEVGASGPGEVARLGHWVRPRAAGVTAVGPAHLAGFGDLETVEREKLSLLDCLEPTGVGWVPAATAARNPRLLASGLAPVFTFGPGGNLEILPNGKPGHWCLHWRHEGLVARFAWQPPFPHSLRNLEAALGLAIGLGYSVENLLPRIAGLRLPPLRGETQDCEGVSFVLDCYNSNPMSLESAIDRLRLEPVSGRRVMVVGTMEELGADEQAWHERMGERLAAPELDLVFVYGRGRDWYLNGLRAAGRDGIAVGDDAQSARVLADHVRKGDQVLFKASRKEALEGFAERVARCIRERVPVMAR
ncbi:MAG: UDP-N-acetylmuramoyl-tripeptide--D-alanyl-D-alanine ligase [Planctomycetota bacterium]